MKSRLYPRMLPLAVAACCAWQSMDLIEAWRHAPFDRLGWLGFLVWIAPAVWVSVKQPAREDEGLFLTALALVLVIAGQVTDLNALRYGALASALGALVPRSARRVLWLAGALSWMPLLGWLAHDLSPRSVTVLRLAFALASTIPWLPRKSQIHTA